MPKKGEWSLPLCTGYTSASTAWYSSPPCRIKPGLACSPRGTAELLPSQSLPSASVGSSTRLLGSLQGSFPGVGSCTDLSQGPCPCKRWPCPQARLLPPMWCFPQNWVHPLSSPSLLVHGPCLWRRHSTFVDFVQLLILQNFPPDLTSNSSGEAKHRAGWTPGYLHVPASRSRLTRWVGHQRATPERGLSHPTKDFWQAWGNPALSLAQTDTWSKIDFVHWPTKDEG